MRVLVVDDEVGICQRLQRELQKEGCEVDYTTSPVGVLERLRNAEQEGKAHALLLLDLRMPKVDGLALLKEIREARLDLDVVIITGYGDEDKAIESIRLGAVDYLRKPISLEALRTTVFRVQQKRAAEEKRALEYSVLVVDDEKEVCARIKRELDKEGYRTAVAYDGVEGLDYFGHNRVDVAIVDIRMPRLSGLEMLEKCREISDDFVSIIVTGHGDQEMAIRALQLSVFNYLRKPISLEELVTSVGKGIELLHLRRGLAARRRELEIETALKEQYAQNLERMVEERTKELKKLSDAVKASTESIVLSDLEGKITDVNEATLKMYGTGDKEDLVGKSSFVLIAPKDRAKAIAAMKEVMEKGYVRDRVYHVITKDGSEIPVEMSVSIMTGVDSEPIGFVGVTKDITERVRAEEALRESEARFRSVAQTANDAIIAVDSHKNVVFWNSAAETMFGYSADEAAGKPFTVIAPKRFHEAFEKVMKRVALTGKPSLVRKTIGMAGLRKDGSEFPLELSWATWKTREGTFFTGIVRDITERMRAEKEIEAKSQFLESLIRQSSLPTFIIDAEGTCVMVNQAFLRQYHVPDESLIIGNNALTVPANVERGTTAYMKRALGGEVVRTPEVEFISPINGSRTVTRGTLFPIYDPSGTLTNVVVMQEDVTERVRAEERLRLLSSAVEQSTEGIAVSDLEGNLLFANDAFAAMHGYAPQELAGKHLSIFHTPEQIPSVEAANRQIQETGEFSGEMWHVRRDGTVFPTLMHNSLMRDETGNAVGMIGTLRDITERKRAEEKLQESEQRFRDVASITGDWIWEVDAEGRYNYASPVVERVLGYTPEEVLGKHYYDFFHPDEREELETLVQEAFQRKEPFVGIVNPNVHKDGRTVILEATGLPLTDAEGNLLGYRGVDRDVTARVRAEEEIKRRGEELEALREISLAISAQLELDELLQNIVEQGCCLLDVKASSVYLVDETRGNLEQVISHGYVRNYIGTRLAPGEGVAGKVLQSGAPLAVDDYSHWEGRSPDWEAEGLTAVLGMPLKCGEQVIGVVTFDEIARARSFDEHDFWLASLFANQAAIAIENARLYQDEQAARERADTLRETSRVVGSTLELDEVLSLVLRQTKRVLAYDAASILLFADDEPAMAAVDGYEDEELVKTEVPLRLGDSPILQTMARDRLPVVIADVREDERWIWVPGAEDIRAWIGSPLLVRDEMIGALMVDSTQPGSYTAADGAIVQALANQTAVAIENARLYKQAQQRLESLTNLNRASQAVASSLNMKDVLEQIVDLAGSVANSDYTSVVLLDEEGEPALGTENFRGVSPITWRIRRSGGITRHVLDSRQPVIVDFISDEGAMSPPLRRPDGELIEANPDIVAAGIHSFAAVPIQAKEKTMGVLFAHSYQPRAFHGQSPLLTTFANQTAIAIENARLFEAEREQRELAEALEQAAAAVSSTLEIDQVLDRILKQVERVVTGDTFNITLVEGDVGRIVRCRGHRQPGTGDKISRPAITIAKYPNLVKMMQTGKPVLIPDTASDPNWVPSKDWDWRRSYVAAPIRVGGVTVGFLNVSGARTGQFGPADARRLEAFADHAATAIENARLFEAERRRRQEAETLRQTALALTTSLDRNQVIKRILIQLQEVVPYDSCSVQLLRGDRLEIVGGHGFPNLEELLGETFYLAASDNPNREVVRTRAPFILEDAPAVYSRFSCEPHVRATIRSWLGVPMLIGDQPIGIITLDRQEPGFYTEEHAQLALAFAAQGAIAIENARLYEQAQQEIAERKRAEEELRFLSSVTEQVIDSIIVTNLNFEITYINEAAEKLYGYSQEELVGKNPGILNAEPEAEQLQESIYKTISSGKVWTGEHLNKRRDGSIFTCGFKISPLVDKQGQTSAYLAIQRDITERVRAQRALQKTKDGLEALYHIGQMINSTLEIDAILDHLTDEAMRVTRATHGQVLVVQEEIGRFERRSLRGFSPQEAELARTVPISLDQGINSRAYTTRQPVRVDDVRDEPDYFSLIPTTRTELAVPIIGDGKVLGNLDLQSPEVGALRDADLDYLNALADQAAIAIQNAHLFQAEREQRELAEALEQAAAAVSSTLELDQVLDRILEQAERIVAGDASNIMLVEDDTARPVRWRGYERLSAAGFPSTISFSIPETLDLQEMVETGKATIIPDTTIYPGWIHIPGQEWLHSYVAAPIQVGGVTVGFLNVDGARPNQFDLADARRLEALASHAATAIENAGLYKELHNHAKELDQRVQERTAQLEAQYARLDAILRSASDGIIVTDAGGEIIQTNPVVQTWLTRTLSPEDAARLRETARDLALRAEERPETVLELTGLDLQLNAAPVSEPGLEEATAVVGIHDVSHLKALDRIKSRFVSNVSHELRTPVTTIKLYTYLMHKRPDKWEGYLDALTQAADRQAQLVEDILQVSRIDAGRLDIKSQPAALNELTEMAVANHQEMAQEQGLTLEHHPAEPGPVALVDAQRMMQVLNNLVENAIHYTPESGKVMVSTGKRETEGRTWATVTVADTGMGIPEKELPHIFERFFRGDEPRLAQISGTGLGLAIVKEIMELHGGRITVESKVKEGSTFTVWLPLA